MGNRPFWQQIERWAVISAMGLAVASYSLAFSAPIYTDEIGWKLDQGHFVDDGYAARSLSLVPSCGPDTFSVPVLLVPVRYFDSFITNMMATPVDIRIYGVFLFLTWLGITSLFLRRLLTPIVGSGDVVAGIVGVVTLGVMPLLMLISRPEQVLLIGVSAFLILAVDERPRPNLPLSKDLALALAMLVGGTVVVCCHPRALLVLPIAALACLRLIQRKALSFTVASFISVFAFVAFYDFNIRLACPGDATVRAIFARESITVAAADHVLGAYLQQLHWMLTNQPGPFFFLTQFGFNYFYISNMIPGYPFMGLGLPLTVLFAQLIGGLACLGLIGFGLGAMTRIRRRQGLIAPAALAASWLFILISMVSRTSRNNYEAELMEPLLVLTSVLSVWLGREELELRLTRPRLVLYTRGGFVALMALSIVSQIALLVGYLPFAGSTWRGPGYVRNQPYSISTSGFSTMEPSIRAAAARCGISPDAKSTHIVLDELTYFAFRHTSTPYLMTYLHPGYWGRGIVNLRSLLASKGSSGAIIGCQWLVPSLALGAVRTGRLCCVRKF